MLSFIELWFWKCDLDDRTIVRFFCLQDFPLLQFDQISINISKHIPVKYGRLARLCPDASKSEQEPVWLFNCSYINFLLAPRNIVRHS